MRSRIFACLSPDAHLAPVSSFECSQWIGWFSVEIELSNELVSLAEASRAVLRQLERHIQFPVRVTVYDEYMVEILHNHLIFNPCIEETKSAQFLHASDCAQILALSKLVSPPASCFSMPTCAHPHVTTPEEERVEHGL